MPGFVSKPENENGARRRRESFLPSRIIRTLALKTAKQTPDHVRAFLVAAVLLCGTLQALRADDSKTAFDQQIAPILIRRCLGCHRGSDAKGGLDLSRRASALAGGESGEVIKPMNAHGSLLVQRIQAEEMPPEKPLPAVEKAALAQWVARGAAWGTDPLDPFRFTSDTRAGYDWRRVGENLARAEMPAAEVVELWLASPGHCANVMHPGHVEMGVAGLDGYWTQVFGRPV